MTVHVAGPLKRELNGIGPQAEATLVAKFTQWVAGDEFGHYWFCNRKLGDDKYLYHVHLIPENEKNKRATWDDLWKKPRRRHERRSDRYLLYAENGRGDYLLIELLDDPGAHKLWEREYRGTLQDYITVAENYVLFGEVPA